MKRKEVLKLRCIIEKAVQSLNDETALQAVTLHPAWTTGVDYAVGHKVRFGDVLYRCLTAHTAQEGWAPADAPSLWAKVLVEEGQILPWQQPDSTNPYRKGDKVLHNGSVWVSDVDNNVWEPGIYGWSEE
jgi:hypothetical protein